MATKRIDQLPATTAQTDHELPAMLTGVTSRVTVASLRATSLPLTGGTLSGNLTVSTASWPEVSVNNTGPAGSQGSFMGFYQQGSLRWDISVFGAEGGGNTGSDFTISRSNDAGATIDTPLSVERSTGYLSAKRIVMQLESQISGTDYGSPVFVGPPSFPDLLVQGYHTIGVMAGVRIGPIATPCIFNNAGDLTVHANLTIGSNAYKPGGGAWLATSDARIKTVTGDYTAGLAEVVQLQPKQYTLKGNDTPHNPHADKATQPPYKGSPNSEAARKGTEFVGLIAQEVETVFPGMVTESNGWIDGQHVTDLRTLDTTELIFALVNCCKELAARVEALEAAAAP